jgi:hypothetical protein
MDGRRSKLQVPGEALPFKVLNIDFPHSQRVSAFMLGSGAPHLGVKLVMDLARQGRRARTKEEGALRIAPLWAWINRQVSLRQADVGPECVCAWRYHDGGGAHIEYAEDGTRDAPAGVLPGVGQGMPISDIVGRLWEHMQQHGINLDRETAERLMEGISMRPRTKF